MPAAPPLSVVTSGSASEEIRTQSFGSGVSCGAVGKGHDGKHPILPYVGRPCRSVEAWNARAPWCRGPVGAVATA